MASKSGGSVFVIVAGVAIAISLGLLAIGLYRQFGNPKPAAQVELPPEDISKLKPFEFRLDDPKIQYFYIDWERGLNSAKKWSSIPHNARGVVTVITPDNINDQANYVANLWSAKNGVAVATPVTGETFEQMAQNVATAAYLAYDLETASIGFALDLETAKIRKRTRPRARPKTKIRRLNRFPDFRIPGR